MKVFLDADVVFSAVYSSKGASRALFEQKGIKPFSSEICLQEAGKALKRYGKELNSQLAGRLDLVKISTDEEKECMVYVKDVYDAHVVAAAKKMGAKLLTTFNLRHYMIRKIENELNIEVMRPEEVLFFAREVLN
ncbi:PIN domain-containing protein [Candidatus Dojkabacteria bacterium]|nr:PIN domain-containing protein [Candidatus Dojkabacteria bacterium]